MKSNSNHGKENLKNKQSASKRLLFHEDPAEELSSQSGSRDWLATACVHLPDVFSVTAA
jgi:hypothetical protein